MSEECAREVRARFGPYEGESYFDHPLGLLRFYQRMPRPIQDPRERAACQMAIEYKEREAAQPKPPRPVGRPKVAFPAEAVDRLRAEGRSERRISEELRISRRSLGRNHPKTAPLKEEFCATPKSNDAQELGQKTPAPPSYSPWNRIDLRISGEGAQASKTEENAANLPQRPISSETKAPERRENQGQQPKPEGENGERAEKLGQKPEASKNPDDVEKPVATERDIDRVRKAFAGLVELDRAAILLILQALRSWAVTKPEFPVTFLREAPQRLMQSQPRNRAGFLIKMARDGKIYGGERFLTDAQWRADQDRVDRDRELEMLEAVHGSAKTKEERDKIKRRMEALKGDDYGTLGS